MEQNQVTNEIHYLSAGDCFVVPPRKDGGKKKKHKPKYTEKSGIDWFG